MKKFQNFTSRRAGKTHLYHIKIMNLIQQLVKNKLLSKEESASLEFEVKNSGKKEEEIILERKLIPEETLFVLKSEILKIPLVTPQEDIPLKILEFIPEDSAKYYQMIPLSQKEDILEVGMIYPEDLKAQEALKFLARQGKFSYRISLINPFVFENLFKQYKNLKKEVTQALEELETELKIEKGGTKSSTRIESEMDKLVEEAPVTRVVAVMLRHAVEGSASDIHIEPGRDKLRIRFRLDGVLYSSLFLPLKIHPAVVARIKILSNLKIDETRIPQDGRFSTRIEGKDIDYRVSTFPTALGEKVVIRVLNPLEGLKGFEGLGLEKRNFEVIQRAIKKPFGLILLTGPTGSGKTTTMYCILRVLNKDEVNIVTLEDPIEYFIEGVNQSQIKPEIDYTFSTGLRHILRQDPNIIMVGEIRDEETATLATHAALTGHIVLSTLHTNNASGVIPRLIDLGIKPFLIPPTLSVAIAQRLVRRLCPECKKEIKPPQKIKEMIVREIDALPLIIKKDFVVPDPLTIWEPVGCKKCNSKGYTDRIAVYEILEMTSELGEIILKSPSEDKIFEEAQRQGMITMKQDGILKVLRGITSIEEVVRVAEEKGNL